MPVCVQMSTEKPPTSVQQPAGPSHAVPQSTPLFRAMNFELFVKPVHLLYRTLYKSCDTGGIFKGLLCRAPFAGEKPYTKIECGKNYANT